jgi:hypothetical protein
MAFIFSIFPIRVLIVLKKSKTIKLKIMKKLYFYLCFFVCKTYTNATVALAENATGSGGSSSYTVGQVFTPMPLGQTAQSIKAQQPVEILH